MQYLILPLKILILMLILMLVLVLIECTDREWAVSEEPAERK